jgi:ABC-type Fe3+-hydroxamate transport system substrate-binding protein
MLLCCSAVAAETPLERAEWLKYFGSFFNKEYEAESQYRVIRNNYNALKRRAQETAPNPRLVVAWVYLGWNSDYVVSKPTYKKAYVEVRSQWLLFWDASKATSCTG